MLSCPLIRIVELDLFYVKMKTQRLYVKQTSEIAHITKYHLHHSFSFGLGYPRLLKISSRRLLLPLSIRSIQGVFFISSRLSDDVGKSK